MTAAPEPYDSVVGADVYQTLGSQGNDFLTDTSFESDNERRQSPRSTTVKITRS